ncbi:GGDEF domain-containing protein [Enterobacteriaceae bacterium 89]|nr:GGDEF domain-containing protein [Enterobacteriaceae bacterium 89]
MPQTLKKYPLTFFNTMMIALLVCAVLVGISVFFLQKQATHALLDETSETMLAEKSIYISHRLEMALNEPIQAGKFISHLINSSSNLSEGAIDNELRHVLEKDFSDSEALSRIGVATADGRYIAYEKSGDADNLVLIASTGGNNHQLAIHQSSEAASTVTKEIASFNVYARPWFIQGMAQKSPFWSSSYYHHLMDDRPVMSWYVPFYRNGEHFAGIISADIHPAVLSHTLKTMRPSSDSIMLLLDSERHIIAASEDQYLSTRREKSRSTSVMLSDLNDFPELLPYFQAAGERSNGPQKISQAGHEYFVMLHPITDKSKQLNWSLLIIMPDTSVTAMFLHSHLKEIAGLFVLFLLIFSATVMLIQKFIRPFNELAKKTQLLGKQPWVKSEYGRVYPEIALLDKELHSASGFIAGLLTEHQARLNNDPDTGLLTRTGLFNSLPLADERNLLLMIRLTNFRDMRSTLGHSFSRQFVMRFTQKMTELTPANTLLCRYSEDLFVLLLPGMNEPKDLDAYWSVLASMFNDSSVRDSAKTSDEGSYIFTGQAGAVLATLSPNNLSECLMNATLAMQYRPMGAHRECHLFTEEMREIELNNVRMHQALLEDLHGDGFHLLMQPIVNLENPQVFSEGECLIRWQSPLLGFIPPDKFIGLAERTGLIIVLGRWIIEEACRQLNNFIARGAPEDFKLHINISAVQFQQADFCDHLLTAIQSNRLMNKNICLEITESVLLQDSGLVIERLNYLRRLGLSVAIDDFGSGYSSLSYLHLLPFDCLKIDRGFVKGVLDDKKSEAVISSVIMLARQFGVPLVAEGIETSEMGEKLMSMGCQKAQGYYYARPQPFSVWHPENGTVPLVTDFSINSPIER